MFDRDAYLSRIGLGNRSSAPSLDQLQRAQVVSIPFENLDPRRGIPVSLAPDDLQTKLIGARRGGYCFELNLLLLWGLEALGVPAEPMLARVRAGADPGSVRPRSHLVLRTRAEGGEWLMDAGFGLGTPLEPLPLAPGSAAEQSGWRYRLREDGEELVLQSAAADGIFSDLYGFVPRTVPVVDLETSNWFTCTHPRSPFVSGLIVGSTEANGKRVVLSDWNELRLAEHTPLGTTAEPLLPAHVPELLERRFGLPASLLGAYAGPAAEGSATAA